MVRIATTVAILSLLLGSTVAHAEVLRHETDYRVSLIGIPIAHADFHTEFENGHYRINGEINSAGLADLVTTIKAHASVSGTIGRSRLEPSRYTLDYKSDKKAELYSVVFQNGKVTSTTIIPPPKRPGSWIAVKPSDLQSVIDPIGGLIFQPNVDICRQTLNVFDGETSMVLKLSPRGEKPFSTQGFKGKATVCGVHFMPLSGYKRNRSDFVYLEKSNDMELWFAKADSVNVYAPVYVRIPTKYGTITITATKYGN